MQLRLRTKFTLVMTSLVLLVAAVLSGVSAAHLLEQLLQATNTRADDLAKQVFLQAKHALLEAGQQGLRPASDAPQEIHDFVRHAFEVNEGLRTQLKAAKENPLIYEVSITDLNGMVLVSTDENMPGSFLPRRTALSQLVQRNFLHQVKVLAGPSKVFELDFPFSNANQPFGEVRVALDSGILLKEIEPSLRTSAAFVAIALVVSTLLAAIVSRATLAPLQDISAQLDRISAGQYDAPSPEVTGFGGSGDELGLVSRKITQVGQQLRGVHEIFSTMRENMNSVMAGLEDGLLLFTRDARAVMISPAAEKFLGEPAGQLLGRRVTEIFPPGHPLYEVLHIESDELSDVAAETELETSEGLTALGRITAGVAHEVKNPLNSMRLWLENLKESLPAESDGVSRQAVQVLDKEIDRLDAVVKRFLDFTRPMDIRLEPTQLAELLREVLEFALPQLQKSNIQLAQLLPIDVPEVYVDRALLKQAVLNLVLNAAEAMPSGGQLRLVLSRRGEAAEITVGDTGKGIPLENRQKIFQLFFTTRPGGSGIGLASTFRIVQLLNGSIDFTSEVGRGTTFRIELPLAA